MDCELCRVALSALLDDEDPGVELDRVDRHLAGCVACRVHERRLGELHRMSRIRRAEPVPDLSGAIVARMAPSVNPHDPVLGWLRSGLTFVGVFLTGLAAALLFSNTIDNPAHLAAWDLAFGGALLFAAWKPDSARGLLPMAALVVVTMTAASLIEVADGHPATHGVVFHLAELTGVVLLSLLARHRNHERRGATLSPA